MQKKVTKAWTDFIICFLFGYLGVLKFRDKKIFMGLLYLCTLGLFGMGWAIDCIKYLKFAIEETSRSRTIRTELDPNEELPIEESNLVLSRGEICHYCRPATLVKTKNVVVGYSGRRVGTSVRVAKGMSIRLGGGVTEPIRENVVERTDGYLSITNQRIVFSSISGAFDNKIASLSSLTPYTDGIALQFGDKHYVLETDEGPYIYQVLARIINQA